MTHPDDLDYCMYSLKNGNPYIPRQLDVTRADDLCMMLQFAGYPSLSEIRQHIEQTASQGRPTAFLLSGREGTGRSTLAEAIIHHYVQFQGIAHSFHLVRFGKRRRIDHNSETRTFTILKVMRNAILAKGNWHHEEKLKGIIGDGDGEGLDDYDLQARAGSLMHFVDQSVRPEIRLGLLIDGVQEDSFMKTLSIAFEDIPMVVVAKRDDYDVATTADSDRLEQREDWQKWARHITLPPLSGNSFGMLADNRWTRAAPEVDCPFDLEGLSATFARRPEPIRGALSWLHWLLQSRLLTYEGTEPWPAAQQLALTAKWIEEMVRAAHLAPINISEAAR